MRYLLAVLLLVHGVAHLPGFLVAFRLASFPELPYRTTFFGTLEDVDALTDREVDSIRALASARQKTSQASPK